MENGASSINTPPRYFYFFALLLVLLFCFILAELFFRSYYFIRGEHIAADDAELCFKTMKLDNLPTDKKNNFINFKRIGFMEDDPLLGLVPKANYTDDSIYNVNMFGQRKKLVIYTSTHHNSQRLTNIEEFSLEKPRGVLRIALFGDSYTCGDEVPLRFGMSYVLKELIPKSEVLNFCVSGRGIEAMYARYILEAQKYQPDLVIFNVFVDDLQRVFDCSILTPNITVVDGRLVIGPRQYPTLKDFYEQYRAPKYESYFLKHASWVYEQKTGYRRRMARGLGLFSLILDDVQKQTRENNSTFIVGVIQDDEHLIDDTRKEYYNKLTQLINDKKIPLLDSLHYFETKKVDYRNQSFNFIQVGERGGGPHLGHFSPIGNALYAQSIKNTLEKLGVIPTTPNYYFANFGPKQPLFLIPEDVQRQLNLDVRTIIPFDIREETYENKDPTLQNS